MVGGFLGAGKTTTLSRLASHYMDKGLRVGIVTNDQAADLVDTNSLRAQGFDVGEVAGACFCCNFDELMSLAAGVKRELGLDGVKMVLITNASRFHRPHVERGLEVLDRNQGEVWAKLDAGTEAYYHTIERTKVPFAQVLDNIAAAAKARPLVIQSLFLRLAGESPSENEIDAYCQRLNEVVNAGGALRLIQVYTVARKPAESIVAPLADEEVDQITRTVRDKTGLKVESYYGSSDY